MLDRNENTAPKKQVTKSVDTKVYIAVTYYISPSSESKKKCMPVAE